MYDLHVIIYIRTLENKAKMNVLENLAKYELSLPEPSTPGGSYISVNIRGNMAFVAIQFPIINGNYLYQGRLGDDVSTK